MKQEDPEPTPFREEQVSETSVFLFTPSSVKSESDNDQDPSYASHLYQTQSEENPESDVYPTTQVQRSKQKLMERTTEYRNQPVTLSPSAVNPNCSAVKSENGDCVDGEASRGLISKLKPLESTRAKKEQSF